MVSGRQESVSQARHNWKVGHSEVPSEFSKRQSRMGPMMGRWTSNYQRELTDTQIDGWTMLHPNIWWWVLQVLMVKPATCPVFGGSSSFSIPTFSLIFPHFPCQKCHRLGYAAMPHGQTRMVGKNAAELSLMLSPGRNRCRKAPLCSATAAAGRAGCKGWGLWCFAGCLVAETGWAQRKVTKAIDRLCSIWRAQSRSDFWTSMEWHRYNRYTSYK